MAELSTLGSVIYPAYNGQIIAKTVIQDASDFPTPVSGVITLQSGYIYEINGTIDIGTDRIEVGGSAGLIGISPSHDTITYTGTGTMFTAGNNESISIQNIGLTCNDGTLISTTYDGAGDFVVLINCNISNVSSLGTVDDPQFFAVQDCFISGCTNGFTITGTAGGRMVVTGNTLLNNTGTFFDLGTAIVQNYAIEGNQSIATPSGAVFLSGGTDSANVGIRGAITGNIFSGDGDVLSGITVKDLKWQSSGNADLDDSRLACTIYMERNATVTPVVQGDNGSITAFADAGGGQVTVTSNGHGLSNTTPVWIVGTTNYDGGYVVSNATTNTFEITATFVATETGDWESNWLDIEGTTIERPDSSRASMTGDGHITVENLTPMIFDIKGSYTGEVSGGGAKQLEYALFVNNTRCLGSIGVMTTSSNPIHGYVSCEETLVDGDVVEMKCRQLDGTTDIITSFSTVIVD